MPEPITPETEPQAETPKVVFDDAQKARVNEIVAEATRRAGREARAEAARLKTELETLQRTQAPPPAADLSLELATAKAELSSLRTAQEEATIKAALVSAVSAENPFDPALCADLLRQNAKVVDGRVVFLDADGNVRLGADFNPLDAAAAARELAQARPYLIRGQVKGGVGSKLSEAPVNVVRLEELFGPKSDGGKANALAMRDPRRYQELRRQAREKGLVH